MLEFSENRTNMKMSFLLVLKQNAVKPDVFIGVGADKILFRKNKTKTYVQCRLKYGFYLAFEIGDGGFSNQGFDAFKV